MESEQREEVKKKYVFAHQRALQGNMVHSDGAWTFLCTGGGDCEVSALGDSNVPSCPIVPGLVAAAPQALRLLTGW